MTYKNVMAKQFNGPIIDSMLEAKHVIHNEAEQFIEHRQHLSIDNATEEELTLIGKFLAIPRPFAKIDDEIVYCDVEFYRLFLKNVMLLRTTKSLLNFQQMIRQFIPSGLFYIEIKPDGDIKLTIDSNYVEYEPFFQIAADTIFNSLPRIFPIVSWDFYRLVENHILLTRIARLIDPSWNFYVMQTEAQGLDVNSTTILMENTNLGNILSAYYSNGIWVAGNGIGIGLYWSEDGKNWSSSNIISDYFSCVYYSNGIWVAGSEHQGLYYSEDGKNWTQSNINSYSIQCVYYSNGIWVAGLSNNYGLYWSEDGKNWSQSNNSYSIQCVYSNGIWVAGSLTHGLYWSEDGKNWSQSDVTSGSFRWISSYNNIWVAGGHAGLYLSINGKDWKTIDQNSVYYVYSYNNEWLINYSDALYKGEITTVPYFIQANVTYKNFPCVFYSDDLWVAGSDHGFYWSEDGKNWTQSNITSSGSFYCFYYSNGLWVAGTSGSIYWSEDGKNWSRSNSSVGVSLCVYCFASLWITGSNRGIYWSEDGKNWTQSNLTSGTFYCIYYANGVWVAGSLTHGLYWSEDGKTWTQSNINSHVFYGLYYANGIWVAGSGGYGLYWSEDGKNWLQSNLTALFIYCVYYSNGLWIAGTNGRLYWSEDGKNWTQSYSSSDGNSYCVYYDNGLWVSGNSSGLDYSIDGKTWARMSSFKYVKSIYYHNRMWVAGSTTLGILYAEEPEPEIKSTGFITCPPEKGVVQDHIFSLTVRED